MFSPPAPRSALAVCALLTLAASPLSGCNRSANAGHDAHPSTAEHNAAAQSAAEAVAADPKLAASLAIDDRMLIGAPISHGTITLFPVIDRTVPDRPKGDFDLLSDALKGETFEVQELDSSGSVPNLIVKNTGKKPVLLVAGDVVQGGKQDRVIVADVVVDPGGQAVNIAVNCVESGRWQAGATGTKFGYGGRGEASLKRTLQVERDQGRTWEKVAALNAGKARKMVQKGLDRDAADLAPSSGTYMASLENAGVKKEVEPAVRGLVDGLSKQDHVVGVVLALGDKVTTAEIYGHPTLFERSRDDLVRSFVMDALSQEATSPAEPPPPATAATFLRDAIAARSVSEQAAGAAVQEEFDGAETRAFKTTSKNGELLHFNVYAK
jgi:hypothetical protein